MQLPILIEPIEGGGFRAQTGAPLSLAAEGATAAEAAQQLTALVLDKIQRGVQISIISIPHVTPSRMPLPADDLYKTDWVFRELQEAIAENRRQEDAAGL